MTPNLLSLTSRDRDLLDRLSQSEPLLTSELSLLFFSGVRTCRRRLTKLQEQQFLLRVYPSRDHRGGSTEALWFLSPNGRRAIGASARRAPSLSIPDLEHRRATARFFLGLIERSVTRSGEGLYTWLGEQQAQQGTGASVRPDGYGRYLLPKGEITFYLEIDRATETAGRVKAKLDAYRQALAADPTRERGNILLVCEGRRRLSNLARCAPAGPPWVWGSVDGEHYELLPGREQRRHFDELPASPKQASRRVEDCLGRRWREPVSVAGASGGGDVSTRASHERPAGKPGQPPGHARRPGGATRATGSAAGEDRALRLLAGATRLMSEEERGRVVSALAELLAEWLTAHPERLPPRLRSPASSGVLDQPDAKEQP